MNHKFVYLYDGSFSDLLNLLAYLLINKIRPINIKDEFSYEPNLLDETFSVSYEKKEDFVKSIISKIGAKGFHIIYKVYLSENELKELIIYYFLFNGIKYGEKIISMRNLNCVNKALKVSQYVGHETHKLKGFLRFKEINGSFLYAEMEPVNNIIFLLSKHFYVRLKNTNWIIKDVKRNILCIHKNGELSYVDGNSIQFLEFKCLEKELEIEELWNLFFKTVAIESRINKRCQRGFMPKKYWKYIIEMSDKV